MKQATAILTEVINGHSLTTPDGKTIFVPLAVFAKLRKLGLLANNKARLSERIYEFLDPQYDCLTDGIRKVLGDDLSGPRWLICNCHKCRERDL